MSQIAPSGDFHRVMRENLVGWGRWYEREKDRLEARGSASERTLQRRRVADWGNRCAAGVAILAELDLTTGDARKALELELLRLWQDLSAFMSESGGER